MNFRKFFGICLQTKNDNYKNILQMLNMSAEDRVKKLTHLYVSDLQNNKGQALSIETLLDVLVVLYDECCNTTLRREKNISEFVEFGEFMSHISGNGV